MILAALIIAATFCLGFAVPRTARLIFCACILAHTLVAITNTVAPHSLPGADTDARRFYNEAVDRGLGTSAYVTDLPGLLNGWNAYINLQAVFQTLGGPSLFLAHSVSVFGCGLCLLALCGLWKDADGNPRSVGILMLCFTAMPSVAFYHSFILREVWQSLVLLLVTRVIASQIRSGLTLAGSVKLIMLILCGAFLHKVMLVLILAIMGGLLMTIPQSQRVRGRHGSKTGKLLPGLAMTFLALLVFAPLIGSSHFLSSALEEGVAEKSAYYAQRNAKDARAEYGATFSVERPWTLVNAFLNYQLEPYPSHVQTASDVVAFAENSWRVWLFLSWLLAARRLQWKGFPISLIMAWFLVELIWAVGTINWGTATRHHVPAYALLLSGSMLARQASHVMQQSRHMLPHRLAQPKLITSSQCASRERTIRRIHPTWSGGSRGRA
jgi:hypothetical protein